jgi:hypothetical protein
MSLPAIFLLFVTAFFAFCYAYNISLAGENSTISTIIAPLFPTSGWFFFAETCFTLRRFFRHAGF